MGRMMSFPVLVAPPFLGVDSEEDTKLTANKWRRRIFITL